MHHLTLEEKVGQLFFIGLPGPELDGPTVELLRLVRPGGVCLFARNTREARQTRTLLDKLRETLSLEPFLSLDQEGGLVDRLRRILTPMPAAGRIKNAEQAAQFGRLVGEAIRILGFNMDFAPVVDVIDEKRAAYSNGLHSRAFGSSAADVTNLSGAFLDELYKGGIAGCLKHFPGLGASEVDSHEELPSVNVSSDELDEVDLAPYKDLISAPGAAAVMVAHAAYPNSDLQETDRNGKLLPSSLSFNIVTDLLRRKLGFDGLAITDDLEMGAILKNYGIEDACKMAVLAGQDMLAICASPEAIRQGFNAVRAAVESGEIPATRVDEALHRIGKARKQLNAPVDFSEERLAEISAEIAKFNEQLD